MLCCSVLLLLEGCKLGEEIEFINFRETLTLDQQPDPFGTHQIIQTMDEGYLIAGSSQGNEILVTRITEAGMIVKSTPSGSGKPSGLIRLAGETERYLLTGNDGNNCFIQLLAPQGDTINSRIILNPIVNDSVGLVRSLSIDAVFPSSDSSAFCVGVLQQSLGKPRMFAFFVKPDGKLGRFGSFRENVKPLALAQRQKDNYFVWGSRNNYNYLCVISNEMALQIENPANNLDPLLLGPINLKNANVAVNNQELFLPITKPGVLDTIYLNIFDQDLKSALSLGVPQPDLLYSKKSPFSSIRIAPVRNIKSPKKLDNYLLLNTRETALNTPESAENIILQKLDNGGKIIWPAPVTYSSGKNTRALGIFQTQDHGYALLLLTDNGEGPRYFLIKTDEEGKTR